jgi:hypothetical protein
MSANTIITGNYVNGNARGIERDSAVMGNIVTNNPNVGILV